MRNAPTKGSHIVPMEKILVIEDDRAINKALKQLLESEGFTVDIAPDGAAGLAAITVGRLTRAPRPIQRVAEPAP